MIPDMPGNEYRQITATDNSRIHNGNAYNTYTTAYRPPPPGDGSYERGLIEAVRLGSVKRIERYLQFEIQINTTDDKGRTALHWAVISGYENIARLLLEAHCHIDAVSELHGTPLCQAAFAGKSNFAQFLVEQGADPKAPGGMHGSALHAACASGSVEIVTLLLGSGADIDLMRMRPMRTTNPQSTFYTCMPLYIAVVLEHVEVVTTLISAGAAVHLQCVKLTERSENDGKSSMEHESWVHYPIHVAALAGNSTIVKALLGRGAIVDARGAPPLNWTPIFFAASAGHLDCLRTLLVNRASANVQEWNHNRPLHLAAQSGQLPCVKLLMDYGAQRDVVNNQGTTPLMLAADGGWIECVQFLILRGASPSIRDTLGNTSVHLAAKSGHSDCIKILIRSGAPVDSASDEGWTPLMCAIHGDHLGCAKILLAHGASINSRNQMDLYPIHIAAMHGRLECMEELLEGGDLTSRASQDGHTPLMYAIGNNNVSCARLLIARGSSLNVQNRAGLSALHLAAVGGSVESIQLLLENGASRDQFSGRGFTPLMCAIGNKEWDAANLLAEGADLALTNAKGQTALHCASDDAGVGLLIRQGAPLDIKSHDGFTPLMVHTAMGRITAVEQLLRAGASIHIVGKEGMNVCDIARLCGHDGIVQLLEQHGGRPIRFPDVEPVAQRNMLDRMFRRGKGRDAGAV